MSDSYKGMNLRSLLRNATTTFGRQLFAGLLTLATTVLIARVYGPEANGAYAIALLLPGLLATFLNLGLGSANVYYLGSGQYQPKAVFRTSITLTSVLSLLGFAIGSALIELHGQELFPGVPRTMLWLALLTFPIVLVQGVVASIFQGLQKFQSFNLSLLAQPLITFFIIAGLSIVGIIDFSWLIIANLTGVIATLVITSIILRDCLKGDDYSPKYKVRQALSYGYKAHFGNMLGFFNYKADIFLVNFLVSPVAAGIYVVALMVSERLWLLSTAVSTVALPRLSELSADEDTRRKLTPLLTRLVLLTTAAGAAMLGLLAYPLIRLVFGLQFESAVIALLILLPGVVFFAAARILANDIAARGRPEINMYLTMVIAIGNILGNWWLIPIYGIAGAALATASAYSFSLVLWVAMYWKLTGIAPIEVLFIKREDVDALRRFADKYR